MDNKKVADFISKTNKEIGANTVIMGNAQKVKVDVISTGSLKIDIATGIGGIPRGRIVEIFGQESSSKTTLALHSTANAQKAGGAVLYVDVEHALDPTYATNLHVNLEELAVSQPNNGEEALSIIKGGLEIGAFSLIVLDSVASLVPRVVFEGEVGDAHMGVLARLMSKVLPMFAKLAADSNTAVIFLNQVRSKIGVNYGSPFVTSGGDALKFYTSMRMQLSRSTLSKDGEDVLGNEIKVKVVKNKLAAPFKECTPEVIYGEGYSKESEIIDLGAEHDIIEKSGSWYSYKGERLGQGKDKVKQLLIGNPALSGEIEALIRQKLGVV